MNDNESEEGYLNFAVSLGEEFRRHALVALRPDPLFLLREIRWEHDGAHFGFEIEPGPVRDSPERSVMAELLSRTYRARSRRVDTATWTIPAPPENYQSVLEDKFPILRGSGLEFRGGWFDLVWATAEWLESLGGDFYPLAQCKEKFGGLRLYGLMSGEARDICDAAEYLSVHICEVCGRQGMCTTNRGWMSTHCAEHGDG